MSWRPPAPPEVLRLRPHEIDPGDLIVGTRRPVERVLFHGGEGCWHVWDTLSPDVNPMRRLAMHAEVQVIRGGPVDDCPPHGMIRPFPPLRLVRP